MQYLFPILIGTIGGAAIGFQVPLSNITGQKLGTLSSVFLVHFFGTLVSLVALIISGGENVRQWRSIALYPIIAGALGLIIISAFVFTIPRIGTTAALGISIAAQLLISVLVDHYGLFEVTTRPLSIPRLSGIVLLLVGAWIVLKN
ncbi:MAG: DMT family transporter [Anaerolineaceae bacterium]|nr:DMT family transporter [Anaerolineaceae bacterium]